MPQKHVAGSTEDFCSSPHHTFRPDVCNYFNDRRFFDLRHWRVVLVDQRACGASTPRGCLTDNTTQVCTDLADCLPFSDTA